VGSRPGSARSDRVCTLARSARVLNPLLRKGLAAWPAGSAPSQRASCQPSNLG